MLSSSVERGPNEISSLEHLFKSCSSRLSVNVVGMVLA